MPPHRSRLSSGKVRSLLGSFSAEGIEAGLVRRYCASNDLRPRRNRLIRSLLAHPEAGRVEAELNDVAVSTVDDLVTAFERLADRGVKETGTVFTPAAIADFMASQSIDEERSRATVIDPSCGCGALLVAALKRLFVVNAGQRRASTIVNSQLFGVDIDADGLRRVTILLALTVLQLGEDPVELRPTLTAQDSLLDDWPADLGRSRFGVVLGNPPYVRFQNIDPLLRERLAGRWSTLSKGNFNLYYAFFELAEEVREPGGVIAYITPSHYFRASSAGALRAWMAERAFPTRIIDFGDTPVFDAAAAYTAITIADDAHPVSAARYVECPRGIQGLARVRTTRNDASVPLRRLDHAPWRLVGKRHSTNIRRIEEAGTPLADLAHIRFGISTLRDRLYLLDGKQDAEGRFVKEFDGVVHAIEPEATRRALRVSDVATQAELDAHPGRIIFPYNVGESGASVWTEAELAAHPGTRRYLEAIRSELAQRDKGAKQYAAWFAYGRTQGLGLSSVKLLTPLYAAAPRFLVDQDDNRMFLNGCSIVPSGTDIDLRLLQLVLSSAVLQYYVEQTSAPLSGGYFSYQKSTLAKFSVPDEVLDHRTALLRATPQAADALLAELYGVSLPGF